MAVQKVINRFPATVLEGEDAVSNPQGGQTVYTITTVAGVQAMFGRVFTTADNGATVRVGFANTGDKFLGIAVSPKASVSKNPIGTNNMNIFNGASVPLRWNANELGVILLNVSTVGQNIEYDSKGDLYALTGTTPTAGRVLLAGATIVQNNLVAGKQATIKIIGGLI